MQVWSGGFEPPYTVRHGIKSTATLPELQHWMEGLSVHLNVVIVVVIFIVINLHRFITNAITPVMHIVNSVST
jgi:hypothetical protein